MNKLVSLEYLDDYSIEKLEQAIEQGIERLNLTTLFKPKMKVLIKASLSCDVSPDKAETTHPSVVRAIVNYLSKIGVSCVVADSPFKKYNLTNLNSVYLNTGMLEMANLTTCELNHNLRTCNIKIPNGVATKQLTVLDVINDVDAIINVGKLKIDENLGCLAATSNIFGLIPGEMKTLVLNRLNSLKEYNNYVIDMFEALREKVVLNVIDGIVALEAKKTPRMLNCLAMSENNYALDAAVFDILNIRYENTLLKQTQDRELFNLDKPYKILGDKLEKFKVEDFSLIDFDTFSQIHKNKTLQSGYFKVNQPRVVIDEKKCKGCSRCSKICPTNAILMKYDKNGELYADIDYKKCIFCNKCLTACPYSVVAQKTPHYFKQLMKEINKYNK